MFTPPVELAIPLTGWLALLGGGEFTFGETEEADLAWLARTPAGPVGFVPAASGSEEYPRHFATYLGDLCGRHVETIPIYRPRDARRERNAERLAAVAAVYLGGGLTEQLVDSLAGSPALAALERKLASGGVVIAIAAAAQACGALFRGLRPGVPGRGLGWLAGAAVEANFDPDHDRRLRQLLGAGEARVGLGIPESGALLLGPAGEWATVGPVFRIVGAEGELEEIENG
ncbi:MAG TPA: Type 1 glutamine amidotransferase-like domain-containing protein [Thermoanaerobaculia bacterium]|mgnify:FL=1|nr:Type 1 glutamine amidotransferase-like domain-containing protein [Thermoanaerobaculia bacterium]